MGLCVCVYVCVWVGWVGGGVWGVGGLGGGGRGGGGLLGGVGGGVGGGGCWGGGGVLAFCLYIYFIPDINSKITQIWLTQYKLYQVASWTSILIWTSSSRSS